MGEKHSGRSPEGFGFLNFFLINFVFIGMPPPPPSMMAPPPPPPTSSQNQGQGQQQQPPWMQQAHAGKAFQARGMILPPPPPPPQPPLSSVGAVRSSQQLQYSQAMEQQKECWRFPNEVVPKIRQIGSFFDAGMKKLENFNMYTSTGSPTHPQKLNSFQPAESISYRFPNPNAMSRSYFEQGPRDFNAQDLKPDVHFSDQMREINSNHFKESSSHIRERGNFGQVDNAEHFFNQKTAYNVGEIDDGSRYLSQQNDGCNLAQQFQYNKVKPGQMDPQHGNISGPDHSNSNYRWFAPHRK